MASVIKVDTFDFFPYVRVTPGEGLDPIDTDFLEPQFTESSGSGEELLAVNERNREFVIPVHLSPKFSSGAFASTKDGLHALIRSVNQTLAAAQTFEYRDEGATNSTFFDIEFARFEPEYNYRRSQVLIMSGVVRVFTKTYGHTGTYQSIASWAGSGAVLVATLSRVPSGDTFAFTKVDFTNVDTIPEMADGRIVAVAAVDHPSYAFRIPAASLVVPTLGMSHATAFLSGASGAAGSQYWYMVSGNVGYGADPFAIINISPGTAYAGRNRLFATVRSAKAHGSGIRAFYNEVPLGATAVASAYDWHLIDLGVLTVPTYQPPATISMKLRSAVLHEGNLTRRGSPFAAVCLSGASDSHVTSAQIGEVYLFPEERFSMLHDDTRRAIGFDTFSAPLATTGLWSMTDIYGNAWSAPSAPSRSFMPGTVIEPYTYNDSYFDNSVNTSDGSVQFNTSPVFFGGRLNIPPLRDMYIRSHCLMPEHGSSQTWLPSAAMQLRKDFIDSNYTRVAGEMRQTNGSRAYLAIFEHYTSASLVACVGFNVPRTNISLGSGIITSVFQLELLTQGNQYTLTARETGGNVIPAAPIASVGGAGTLMPGLGRPAWTMFTPSSGNWTLGMVFDFGVAEVPSVAIGSGDSYTMALDDMSTTSGGARRDLTSAFKGTPLTITPSTHRIAALVAPVDQGAMNEAWGFTVSAKERFTYFR